MHGTLSHPAASSDQHPVATETSVHHLSTDGLPAQFPSGGGPSAQVTAAITEAVVVSAVAVLVVGSVIVTTLLIALRLRRIREKNFTGLLCMVV